MLTKAGCNVNFLRSRTKIQTMTESHEEFCGINKDLEKVANIHGSYSSTWILAFITLWQH